MANPAICHIYSGNYGNILDNRRSTTGFVFMLGGAAVSWNSKRRTSSGSADSVVELNEDNQACIKLAHNPCASQRTKSMDLKCHFLRQAAQEGKTDFKYVDTKEQLADIFTKQLPSPQFMKPRAAIGRSLYKFG